MQSVPGPGQTPQVFETSEALTATIAANAIPAATTQPWTTTGKDTSTWIAGTANNIQVGNALLFISASGGAPSITGPAILCFVTAVVIDPASGNTQIFWDQQLPFGAGNSSICLYVLRTKAALFGVNAPWPGIFPYVQETSSPWNFVPPNIPGYPTNPSNDWSFTPTDSATINLDNSYPGLNPAGRSERVRGAGGVGGAQVARIAGVASRSFKSRASRNPIPPCTRSPRRRRN